SPSQTMIPLSRLHSVDVRFTSENETTEWWNPPPARKPDVSPEGELASSGFEPSALKSARSGPSLRASLPPSPSLRRTRRREPQRVPPRTESLRLSRRGFAAVVFALLLAPAGLAQLVAPAAAARDEPVTLSAFEVTADPSDSYEALNTSGVTGTNRSIRSLPMTMNVYTRTFIDELNATDISDIMKFTPNVTYALDSTGGGTQGPEQYRLRGLGSKEERRRNGFVSLSRSDVFSTERLEVLRGAQALLYGQGVSSGAINTVTKRATEGRFGELRMHYDSNGTGRFTLDFNDTFGPYSLRAVALSGHQAYWQDNLADEPRGFYLEGMRRIGRRFVLRANHEYIEENSRTRSGNQITIRDNRLRDPRVGRSLDDLLYNGGDTAGIIIGGEPLSYKNFRSAQSVTTGRRQNSNTTVVTLEGDLSPRLSARLAWNYQRVRIFSATNNGAADLVAPTDSNAIDGQWSMRVSPQRNRNYWHIRALQGAAVSKFELGNFSTHQLVAGGEQRLKQQTFINQRIYQVDAQNNFVPGNDSLGGRFLPVFYVPVQDRYINALAPPPGYRWADTAAFNSVPATPLNPRGLSGASALTLRVERQLAGYVNWLGNWFNNRAETMVGVRLDHVTLDNDQFEQRITDQTAKSGLAGLVFNITPDLGLYANGSKSFAAAGTFQATVDNTFPQPGKGVSAEAGIKFDLWSRRISGSLAFYDNRSQNEALALPSATRNIIDALGLNGRNGGTGVTADVRSRGVELVLTAQPARGWRVYFSLGTNDATITSGMKHDIFYNDQFNVSGGNVKVKQADGSLLDLLVPSVRSNAASPKIPLTVAMLLQDPASGYRATLNPASGLITNAAALFLTTPGVGTGATGLPITQHQLGFVAPNNGIYEVFTPGDKTTPNAGFTVSGNTNYEFSAGPLKGCSTGGTVQWQREIRQGYANLGGSRRLYFQPEFVRVDWRLGYRVKLRGASWNLQFTTQNLFDVQPVEKTLAESGAFTLVTVSQPPRTYLLSAGLRF
ncbi:MAG: putative ferrichrome-iron TonB-dependent receptor, partial [Verrucomicrobiota bacterium]